MATDKTCEGIRRQSEDKPGHDVHYENELIMAYWNQS